MIVLFFLIVHVVFSQSPGVFSPSLPGSWTWLQGTPSPIPFDQGSETIFATATATAVARDPTRPVGYIFGGHNGGFSNDYLYRMNLNDGSVEKMSGAGPAGRWLASMWFSKETKCLYLFGGATNNTSGFYSSSHGYGNDLWEYNLTTGNWNLLGGFEQPNSTEMLNLRPRYGEKGNFSSHNWPGGRRGAITWISEDGKLLGLIGGGALYFTPVNQLAGGSDVWIYDLRIKQWSWVAGYSFSADLQNTNPYFELNPGKINENTYGMASNGDIYLLGLGSDNTKWLWKFDSRSYLWKNIIQIDNSPNVPAYRIQGNLIVNGDKHIFLLGGREISSLQSFDDFWGFHIPSAKWVWISGNISSKAFAFPGMFIGGIVPIQSAFKYIYPPGIFRAKVLSESRSFFLIGGSASNSRMVDFLNFSYHLIRISEYYLSVYLLRSWSISEKRVLFSMLHWKNFTWS
jgi:hypothetical protein